jgi:NTE family protein
MSELTTAGSTGDVALDPSAELGYRRSPALQEAFAAAAAALLEKDGWSDPQGKKRLVADLALEGGGVKGIGLVGAVLVLDEAGYAFRGVAGTSAGAIAAALIAGISKAGRPMIDLKRFLGGLQFSNFMPEGKLHEFLDHHGGKAGALVANAAILTHKLGLYPGDYLYEWLTPILHDELGIKTFADLKLSPVDDPGMSLPPGHDYSLVVHTADVTRARLVRLPWDYGAYGHDPDKEDVVGAVRASMSIPFFFEPVTVDALPAVVDVPTPDGGTVKQHYDAGTVTWVDGGLLRNFPIGAFDRIDGAAPRWPTIGIKLSALSTNFGPTEACTSALGVGERCVRTMMNEWDAYGVEEDTAGRTIFVPNAGLTATDFHLTDDQQNTLFINGVRAATDFVIEMASVGGVPRSAEAGKQVVMGRRVQKSQT